MIGTVRNCLSLNLFDTLLYHLSTNFAHAYMVPKCPYIIIIIQFITDQYD